jgi:demethylmenaquinone methyltransferase/2-methoxy-6-polyprenyl-1,4-benzoquinol methylase
MTLALHRHRPKSKGSVILSEGAREVSAAVEGPAVARSAQDLPAPILAADFSHNMLSLALPKFASKNILPIEADALHLPLPDNSVDLVTTAFGFRNLSNYPAGLAELHRVLRPGGQIAILEFNQPTGLIGAFYNLYFRHILPRVGGFISHSPREYAYLPGSVARFPSPPRMISLIAAAGFASPTWTAYTLGVAGLFRATKP